MATFFGEVIDVHSRSAWWSDSDEPDPINENLNFAMDVKEKSEYSVTSEKCQRIYVNNVKHHPKDFRTILTVSLHDDSSEKSLGILINMYRIDDDQCWITINHKLMSAHKHLTVKLVDFLFENVLKTFRPDLHICIMSKDFGSGRTLQYLCNDRKKMNQMVSGSIHPDDMCRMYPPKTAEDETELAIMEYCIVYRKSFVFFILPSQANIELFPKFMMNSLKQFKDFSSSNIII